MGKSGKCIDQDVLIAVPGFNGWGASVAELGPFKEKTCAISLKSDVDPGITKMVEMHPFRYPGLVNPVYGCLIGRVPFNFR